MKSLFLKWLLASGLLGAGSLASILGLSSLTGNSSSGSGSGYSQVPELSLTGAGLAVVLLTGTALLIAEKRRKAVPA